VTVKALALAGLSLKDIVPTYLAPADATAAFNGGTIDAWVVWDPYYAIVQERYNVRVIADTSDKRLASASGTETPRTIVALCCASMESPRRRLTFVIAGANPRILRSEWLSEDWRVLGTSAGFSLAGRVPYRRNRQILRREETHEQSKQRRTYSRSLDGSSWSKVIPILLAKGLRATAVQLL
jgi:hypothetical protein